MVRCRLQGMPMCRPLRIMHRPRWALFVTKYRFESCLNPTLKGLSSHHCAVALRRGGAASAMYRGVDIRSKVAGLPWVIFVYYDVIFHYLIYLPLPFSEHVLLPVVLYLLAKQNADFLYVASEVRPNMVSLLQFWGLDVVKYALF